MANSLETFRTTEWNRAFPVTPNDWAEMLRAWLGWYHRQRTAIADRNLNGSTLVGWMWTLLATLPVSLPKRMTDSIVSGVASHNALRSPPQPRDQRDAGANALTAAHASGDPRLWLAVAFMVRSGQRATDATWVAGGWIIPGSYIRTPTVLSAQPIAEKTDQLGSRVPVPMVLTLEPTDEHILSRWSPAPLSATELSLLHSRTKRLLHEAGYTDVRVPRRDRAADFDLTHDRKATGALLRHKPKSAHTASYTGPSAAAHRMAALLTNAPPISDAKQSTPTEPTQAPPTYRRELCVPSTPPVMRGGLKDKEPLNLRVPLTMIGGPLPAATRAAVAKAAATAHNEANKKTALRLLGL